MNIKSRSKRYYLQSRQKGKKILFVFRLRTSVATIPLYLICSFIVIFNQCMQAFLFNCLFRKGIFKGYSTCEGITMVSKATNNGEISRKNNRPNIN